ncbi:hypothetical protein RJ639_035246 [Escallonia herrerae]|uniref:Protein kinase domain-containing protein n=1 Tax=Escallonia herrerae TaxID=1293975 RepID=A0AA88X2Z0_9ASTE|nr:hypothetical protein RJ639_035246 [Escallonia herrerae]
MSRRITVYLLVVSLQILAITADNSDYVGLNALREEWEQTQLNWVGSDPCAGWEGISCINSRVTSITLASMDLIGQLSGDIQSLSELQTLCVSAKVTKQSLDFVVRTLVGCAFSGPIPDEIGSLQQLNRPRCPVIGFDFQKFPGIQLDHEEVVLADVSNPVEPTRAVPRAALHWICYEKRGSEEDGGFAFEVDEVITDVSINLLLSLNNNSFIGSIPASIGNLSNLDWLDLSDNKLNGKIPVSSGTTPGLDMLVKAKHFHFGRNKLSGEIPSQLFNSKLTLIHVLFENNHLSGSIPSTLGLVQTLEVLRLDRNSLSGPVPSNLNNLTHLSTLDMSNNSFESSDVPPWFSTLRSLTTLVLRNNKLNGTLDIGPSHSNQLQLVDLQNNRITDFTQTAGYDKKLILNGNPLCWESGSTNKYCTLPQRSNSSSYSTPPANCPSSCMPDKISSPNCNCAYPYTGTLSFRAPSFSDLGNSSIYTSLQDALTQSFHTHQLPVDSVSLSNPTKNLDDYLVMSLKIFPSGQDYFNRTGISGIGFVLSNQTFKPPLTFGPFSFNGFNYGHFAGASKGKHKSSNNGIAIGAAVGGSALVLLLVLAGVYAFSQKKRAERANKQNHPFASWDGSKNSGGVPQLKGARCFSFDELKKWTNNFSEANNIGSGGYGMVYRGTLPSGQLVAIKRAQQGSAQGGLEFKTEIELLSRVHHKNVVGLVGFCFERAEQMLVYEFIANGTLREGLLGFPLASPESSYSPVEIADSTELIGVTVTIIPRHPVHQQIQGEVTFSGISIPSLLEGGVISSQGYMDPEYYMTQQLTEKSDVYSFGVVLLELITARSPIEKGKYIVRGVRQAMDRTKDLYNLQGILDPAIGLGTEVRGLEKFVDLALSCVEEAGLKRPTMSEVVKEIESIMELAGLNPNAESAPTSASYESSSKGFEHPYSNNSLFSCSDIYPPSEIESK